MTAAVTGAARRAARGTFRSLGVRNFRLYFFGQLTSQAGTWMQTVSLTWVVLQLTDSGVALGLVTAAQFLPVLLLGAWGGVLADRFDRWKLMLTTQSIFTVVAGTIATLMLLDLLTVALIYPLAATLGTLTAIDNPSRRTLVGDLVEEPDIPNAVGLHSAMMTGSRVIGPAAAGLIITTAGVAWCFVINTASYLAVIGALLAMDRSTIRRSPRVARAKGQLVEGLRYVWATPVLRNAIALLAVVGTLAFEYQVTLPLLAERSLGAGAGGFTLLYSAMSLGSVCGALVMARRTRVDLRFLVRAAWALVVATVLLSAAPGLGLALLAMIPVGASTIFLISGANALIQVQADDRMKGRALALTTVVFLGSTPIGGPIAGWVSEHFGPRYGLLLGAVGTAAIAVVITLRSRGDGPADDDGPAGVDTDEPAGVGGDRNGVMWNGAPHHPRPGPDGPTAPDGTPSGRASRAAGSR